MENRTKACFIDDFKEPKKKKKSIIVGKMINLQSITGIASQRTDF